MLVQRGVFKMNDTFIGTMYNDRNTILRDPNIKFNAVKVKFNGSFKGSEGIFCFKEASTTMPFESNSLSGSYRALKDLAKVIKRKYKDLFGLK